MKSLEEALEALGKSDVEVVKSVRRYPNITWTRTNLVLRTQTCPIAQYLREATGEVYLVSQTALIRLVSQEKKIEHPTPVPIRTAIDHLDRTALFVTKGESCPNPHWSPKAGTKERRGDVVAQGASSEAARKPLPQSVAKVAPVEESALDLLEVG